LRREDNRGRPWHDTRAVFHGVLWILGSGAQWIEMPEKYPPYQTCHRRFQQWVREGKLVTVLRLLARHLHERSKLHLDEAFVDATFESAKKGASPSVRPAATTVVVAKLLNPAWRIEIEAEAVLSNTEVVGKRVK
jgi:transposase